MNGFTENTKYRRCRSLGYYPAIIDQYRFFTAFAPSVLALAPGGLAGMSLIALALGIETAFVATHHVARIAMIVIAAPLVFRKLGIIG